MGRGWEAFPAQVWVDKARAWLVRSEKESELQLSRMALIIRARPSATLPSVPCGFQRGNPGWEERLAQSPMTIECPTSLPLTGPASSHCCGTPSFKLLGLRISFEVGHGRVRLPHL